MDKLTIRILSMENVMNLYKGKSNLVFSIVEDAFKKWTDGKVLMPAKSSQIFDQKTQNRINCMPSSLLPDGVSGVKLVSVFPTNASKGLQNVTGIMLLSEINSGFPIAVIDGTLLTSIRTAAVGCVAAKYLAPSHVEKVGFIGAGREARMHFVLLKALFPNIKECRISSRSQETVQGFINEFKPFINDVDYVDCAGDSDLSVRDVDIIITAISGQCPVLKAYAITKGALYIHVGGWEDEFNVVRKADKIICDDWDSCKHRTQTISRMYMDGLLNDNDIYANLGDIITGKKKGRANDDEFIYFNSVGLSFIDLSFANETYKLAIKNEIGEDFVIQSNNKIDYCALI